MTRLPARLYPYRGRIVRPQSRDGNFGAARTLSGHRYVRTLYDALSFARRMSQEVGERAAFTAGSISDVQFRFQTPRYLPGVEVSDELVLVHADGSLEAYNIVTPAPFTGRPGIGGRRTAGYTVLLARRKAAQNADMDIYL